MDNQFQILLQAVLDASYIGKADIGRIQKIIDQYKIKLDLDVDANNILEQVKSALSNIEKQTGIKIPIDDDGILKAIKQTDKLVDSMAKVRERSEQARKAEAKRHELAQNNAINKNIEREYADREKLAESMAKGRERIESQTQAEKKRQEILQNRAANKAIEEEYNQRKKILELAESIRKANPVGGTGKIDVDYTKLLSQYEKLEKLGVILPSIKTDFEQLSSAYSKFRSGSEVGNEELINSYNDINDRIRLLTNSLTVISETSGKTAMKFNPVKQATFENTARSWLRINSVAKEYQRTIENLIERSKTANALELKDIEAEYRKIITQAKATGKVGKNLWDSFTTAARKFGEWGITTSLITKSWQAIKQLFTNINELDDALTNISYTMDVTDKQLQKVGKSSLNTAKELNTSASKVFEAVKTYANANESAQSIIDKAKPTIMMSNVTGMSTENTVDILQGTMEQFELAEDNLMHVSDVLQKVSMGMPYDFSKGVMELSEGIQASGNVAKDAGYDLEHYTALLGTLISKTRQSGAELGRSLRTMMVRTTKASSSALAGGEVTEDDLSNAEAALRRVGIEIRKDNESFKDFDTIMGELYNKIDDLSQVDLSNVAYEVASTRQTNVFKQMIKSYGDYMNMVEQANNADGATLQNQEKYAESLTGKLGELSAIWESIGDNAISSELLKGLVDAGIAVSALLEKFGLLETLTVGGGIAVFIQNLDWLNIEHKNLA